MRRVLNLSGAGMHNKRGLGNGNSNARVLNQILAKNQTIDHLVLSDTGLDDVSGATSGSLMKVVLRCDLFGTCSMICTGWYYRSLRGSEEEQHNHDH